MTSNLNESSRIQAGARKLQPGPLNSQKSKPIAFYSRKLNYIQVIYLITECDILSMVKTLKVVRNTRLGQ